jgi:hypothetical protein
LAFALFDRVTEDGDQLSVDPIALLEAVRRHADQIDIFCQAGQVAPMKEHRPIVAYLERSVHGVVPPNPAAIFHPKVWMLRYRNAGDELHYRLLCLSRNLTFDRSWDTLLRLEGKATADTSAQDTAPVAEFIRSLPPMTVNGVDADRLASLTALADELAYVTFTLPDGFRSVRFWPMGHDGATRWPLEGRIDRLLTISPFLTVPMVQRLASRGRRHVMVARSESLDLVGSNALNRYAEVLTLSTNALADPEVAEGPPPPDEALAESPAYQLQGLHAKCYVADAGGDARVWTGSANATDAAFGSNVEFLVELTGPKRWFGIAVTLGQRAGEPSLRSILDEYVPANAEPRQLSTAEELERELDVFRRWLASHRFAATVARHGDDLFSVELRGASPSAIDTALSPTRLTCRPLTTRADVEMQLIDKEVRADFPGLSFEGLTSFFVITASAERGGAQRDLQFVVNAELVGAPNDRRQRILASLLKNREELLRFLLMLLSGMGESGQLAEAALGGGKLAWAWSSESLALYEPMVRALARDPGKIDEISSLMDELAKTPDGRSILPEGWNDIWEPIRTARKEIRS